MRTFHPDATPRNASIEAITVLAALDAGPVWGRDVPTTVGCLPPGLSGTISGTTLCGDEVSITASEARKRLFPLIEQVNDDQAAVEIVSKRGTAYLVPAEEYRSLRETVHLLQSPKNAERLRNSIAHARAGRVEEHELAE